MKAGSLVRSLQGKSIIREKNASFNLVTEADTQAEDLVIALLMDAMPDAAILSEESNFEQNISVDSLWIVDPLDGTTNFAHSIPHYSVSIAYAYKGVLQAGVVYDPSRDELFSASHGDGAFLNGKQITVSSQNSLSSSIIGTGFYYSRGELMEKTLQALHRLFKAEIHGMRRMGSAALDLCWVACGRFDGYFEYMLSPWDFAAGTLILKEAGGQSCDREGEDRGLYSKGIICSNGKIQRDLLETVKW